MSDVLSARQAAVQDAARGSDNLCTDDAGARPREPSRLQAASIARIRNVAPSKCGVPDACAL